MLEINQVQQSFRSGFWLNRVEVLKGVSFQVPTGSIFGFLGPNGAGKTTLIHLVVGMKRPREGVVLWKGVPTFQNSAKSNIGYLPERPYFHDFLTGEEFLVYFGRLSGMKKSTVLSRVDRVLASVGMAHARKLELRKYSKGMLQRIGIAQAILHDPELLVLDEPMSGLDPTGRKEIRELILELSREGRTILFSSHVIPDVEAICDRVAIIRQGKIVDTGIVSNFLEQETLGVDVEVAGLSAAQLPRLPHMSLVSEKTNSVRIQLDSRENVEVVLRAIMDAGGRIRSVAPIRSSLEERYESRESKGK